ncbi:MAG: 16S rRNA processing protein RimM [Peptostreptococcaceae bacterium]|nr:16S rRNA processing protein RimM [Peptostreptococcaceae bacterium]
MLEKQIKIGEIVSAVGIKGEVKIYNFSDVPDRFESDVSIYLGTRENNSKMTIDSIRYQKNMPVVRINGTTDRNEAEKLIGKEIFISESSLGELPEDTFYVRDLVGVLVYDKELGLIGEVVDVLQNTAQDLYKVKTKEGKEVFIPAVKEFVLSVDIEQKRIDVSLIPGFME